MTTPFRLAHDLGSVRRWVAPDGAIRASFDYDSYGNPFDGSGLHGGQRFGYTAREWSDPSELLALRARGYDPEVGRFMSPDPLGVAESVMQGYAYANNAPSVAKDPLGLEPNQEGYWSSEQFIEAIRFLE